MKTYHDIVGDGGSRVLEQVQDLHARIAARLSAVRHVVAIGSGKGGVGKSTLTFQLALALRRRGLQIAILDADVNGPSQAQLAGLTGVAPLPGPDGAVLPRSAEGVRVLSLGGLLPEPAPLDFEDVAGDESHTWRSIRERTLLLELVSGVGWGRLDLLLLDLPPGAERTVQYAQFLGARTAFVLVSQPSPLSRSVVARSVTALQRYPNPVLGYVLNMAGAEAPRGAAQDPLDRLICLGAVPFDAALSALTEPAAATTAAIDAAAARVLETLEAR